MKKVNIFVALIILIFASCSNIQKQEFQKKNIDFFIFSKDEINSNFRTYNLSEFYTSATGFSLDNSGGPVGNISKAMIFRNILFILDSHYAKKIFAYDLEREGMFMFSIGAKGKGPGEFLQVTDFTIDSLNQQLLIIDSIQRRLSYFDLNGNFQDIKKLPFEPTKIFCDRTYLYMTKKAYNDGFCLEILDNKLNTLAEYLPSKSHPSIATYYSGFLKIGNKLLLNYPNCDTIFQINNTKIIPYVVIESGEHSFCSNMNNKNLKYKEMLTTYMGYAGGKNKIYDNILFPTTFFEDEKLKLFEFNFNKYLYSFIKRKSQNDELPILGNIKNDLFGSHITFIGYDENYGTIGIVNPESMLNADLDLAQKNNQNISNQLMQELTTRDQNSNPSVVFLK